MGKTFETKRRIIDLLKDGHKTPTEIYKTLGLAPSTVSQHLKELANMGKVEELYDEHFKNIKYYKISENAPVTIRTGSPNSIKYLVGAVVLLAILAVAFIAVQVNNRSGAIAQNNTAYLSGSQYVQISLTDPPHVPNGTTSLYINYSGLELLVAGSAGTKWIDVNSSGSVDLMGLINASKVIGNANISANTTLKSVRFDITNATITVDGSTYPVALQDNHLVANVSSSSNSTNSTVLLDLSPTVAVAYTNSSPVFVMVPSICAVRIPGIQGRGAPHTKPLNNTEKYMISRTTPNITITSVSLSTVDNVTTLSVAVKDNSNESVYLNHISIFGNANISSNLSLYAAALRLPHMPVQINEPAQRFDSYSNMPGIAVGSGVVAKMNPGMPSNFHLDSGELNEIINGINVSQGWSANASWNNATWNGPQFGNGFNLNDGANLTIITKLNLTNGEISQLVDRAISARQMNLRISNFNAIDFIISQNGTLMLPPPPPEPCDGTQINASANSGARVTIFHVSDMDTCVNEYVPMFNQQGYNLSSGQSATFKFTGSVSFADGKIAVGFRPGTKYEVAVTGGDGAFATANVIAG